MFTVDGIWVASAVLRDRRPCAFLNPIPRLRGPWRNKLQRAGMNHTNCIIRGDGFSLHVSKLMPWVPALRLVFDFPESENEERCHCHVPAEAKVFLVRHATPDGSPAESDRSRAPERRSGFCIYRAYHGRGLRGTDSTPTRSPIPLPRLSTLKIQSRQYQIPINVPFLA